MCQSLRIVEGPKNLHPFAVLELSCLQSSQVALNLTKQDANFRKKRCVLIPLVLLQRLAKEASGVLLSILYSSKSRLFEQGFKGSAFHAKSPAPIRQKEIP